MTTTKELREALQTVEPPFPGFEVDAIRHRARRIRRRHRVAAAVLACSVATGGAAALPHVAEHLAEDARRDEADAAIADPAWTESDAGTQAWSAPASGFSAAAGVAPRPLPKVTSEGRRRPVGAGTWIWLRPPGGGSSAPAICSARSASGTPSSCDTLDRAQDGTANWQILRDGDTRILVAIVDGAVRASASVGSAGKTPVAIDDLGFGYQAVTVATPARVTDVPFRITAVSKDDVDVARWAGVLASRSEPMGLLAVPSQWPRQSQLTELPDTPLQLWTEKRPGEANTRFCTAPRDASHAADCAPLTGTAGGVAHAFGLTSPDGKLDIESIVTSTPIAVATATLNGASTPVMRLEVGNGYQLITASFPRGGAGTSTVELSGYDGKQRKVVGFTFGVG